MLCLFVLAVFGLLRCVIAFLLVCFWIVNSRVLLAAVLFRELDVRTTRGGTLI